jgi:hypothetical protein
MWLMLKALHNLYWVTVWDDTTDSIGYFWIILPFLAALFCGLLLSVFLTRRARIAGLLYLLLLPAMVYAVSRQAQQVDYRQLTEQRARRVDGAIRAYYAGQGHYPPSLHDLTPRYLLYVPSPLILIGQGWCYQGSDDSYQLGYVTHESWMSRHVSGQLVGARGDAGPFGPICAAEIEAIEAGGP